MTPDDEGRPRQGGQSSDILLNLDTSQGARRDQQDALRRADEGLFSVVSTSGAYGRTLEEAAGGVVHGNIRAATAGAIRSAGGTVDHAPEAAFPGGPINARHVHVTEGPGATAFSDVFLNPVPKQDRVSARPRD